MTLITVIPCWHMVHTFTSGHNAIMAGITVAIDVRMIKAAIQSQFYKTGSIVAFITFNSRLDVVIGFSDGLYTVVTATALTKNFLMINKADQLKSESRMAGLAEVTGREVIR